MAVDGWVSFLCAARVNPCPLKSPSPGLFAGVSYLFKTLLCLDYITFLWGSRLNILELLHSDFVIMPGVRENSVWGGVGPDEVFKGNRARVDQPHVGCSDRGQICLGMGIIKQGT